MERLFYLLFVLYFFPVVLQAQEKPEAPQKGSFKIETNLGYWGVGGPNLNAFYIAPKRFTVGVQYVAGFELPEFARDQFFDAPADLTVDWDFLLGIEARYRLNDAYSNEGFFLLSGLGYEGWTVNVADNDDVGTDSFTNWYAALGLGYNWYPFKKKNFHIGVAYNLVIILNNTDDRNIGDISYRINGTVPPSLLPSALYAAWRF